jgi:hypothetical protein
VTPRTYKINKHRSFSYYTPEDVMGLLADLRRLEGELNHALQRASHAESKVAAWERTMVVTGLPMMRHPGTGWGPGGEDPVDVPALTPEKLTSILDRLARAEAAMTTPVAVPDPHLYPEGMAVRGYANLAPRTAPPAAVVPADYKLGETIYTPPSEEVRFCYSRGQPGNVDASRLGEACRRAAEKPGGDYIDGGLSLLKELEARGYGVFRFAKSAHEQAQQPAAAVPDALDALRMCAAVLSGEALNKSSLVRALEAAKNVLAAAESAQGVGNE